VLDSNQRRREPAGLQPAPFGRSGNPPRFQTFSGPRSACGPAYELSSPNTNEPSCPGAGEGTRTPNPLFTKQELYRLSYANTRPRRAELRSRPAAVAPITTVLATTSECHGGKAVRFYDQAGDAPALAAMLRCDSFGGRLPAGDSSNLLRGWPRRVTHYRPARPGAKETPRRASARQPGLRRQAVGPRGGPASGSAGLVGCQAQFIPEPGA
jgi:hypothetical protein